MSDDDPDDDRSRIQKTIVNLPARLEREINEIEVLLTTPISATKQMRLEEIKNKLDLMHRGLNVLLEQEEFLSRKQRAEIQLLQRHIQKLKLVLETASLPTLLAMLNSLRKQLELVEGFER